MKDNKAIDEISQTVDWYYHHGAEASVEEITHARDVIACNCWYLAGEVGDAKSDYNGAVFIEKINVMRKKQSLMEGANGLSATKAEAKALLGQPELFEKKLMKEAYAYKMELLLRSAHRIQDAMQQRISNIKKEYENANRTGG